MAITTAKVNIPAEQLMPLVSYCVATELGKLKIPMGEDFQTKLNYLQELQSLCLQDNFQFFVKKVEKLEHDFNVESLRKSEQMREHNEILQRQTAVIEEFAVWRFYLEQGLVTVKRSLQEVHEEQKGMQLIQDRIITDQCRIKKELHLLNERFKVQKPVEAYMPCQQLDELTNKFRYLNSETMKLNLEIERVKCGQTQCSVHLRRLENLLFTLNSKFSDFKQCETVQIPERVKMAEAEVSLVEVDISVARPLLSSRSSQHPNQEEPVDGCKNSMAEADNHDIGEDRENTENSERRSCDPALSGVDGSPVIRVIPPSCDVSPGDEVDSGLQAAQEAAV